MLVETKESPVEFSTNLQERIPFSLNDAAIPLVIKLVADMYPQPLETVLTEYLSNAYDSHMLAEIDRPVQVSLPNKFSPYYKVRDFGVSMSHEEIINIYSQVAFSPKTQHADLIGGKGIGKLCFAAYSGIMELTAYKDGYKRVYFCRLQDGVGEITLINKEESSEEQGVEISIPIREKNFSFCLDYARKNYGYRNPQPIVKGYADFFFDLPKVRLESSLWRITNATTPSVIVGGVKLPITDSSYSGRFKSLEIIAGPSDVLIAPSRTDLIYKEQTVEFFEKVSKSIRETLIDTTNSKINTLSNIWEAHRHWVLINSSRLSYHLTEALDLGEVKFKNQSVYNAPILRFPKPLLWSRYYKKPWVRKQGYRVCVDERKTFNPSYDIIAYNDQGLKHKAALAAAKSKLAQDSHSESIIIISGTLQDKQQFIDDNNLLDSYFIDLSSVEIKPIYKTPTGYEGLPYTLVSVNCGGVGESPFGCRGSDLADLKGFSIPYFNGKSIYGWNFYDIKKALAAIEGDDVKLYGVPQRVIHRTTGLKCAVNHIIEYIKTNIKDIGERPVIRSRFEHRNVLDRIISSHADLIPQCPPEFKKIIDVYKASLDKEHMVFRKFIAMVMDCKNIHLPESLKLKNTDITNLWTDLEVKYPLVSVLDKYSFKEKAVLEYMIAKYYFDNKKP